MAKFQNLTKKTKAAGDKKVSDEAIDKYFLTPLAVVGKVTTIGTFVIAGACAVVAAGVAIDKAKNPQDYAND